MYSIICILNFLSVGCDLIPYPILHQFFENDSVLCFPDDVWKVVEDFFTTVVFRFPFFQILVISFIGVSYCHPQIQNISKNALVENQRGK